MPVYRITYPPARRTSAEVAGGRRRRRAPRGFRWPAHVHAPGPGDEWAQVRGCPAGARPRARRRAGSALPCRADGRDGIMTRPCRSLPRGGPFSLWRRGPIRFRPLPLRVAPMVGGRVGCLRFGPPPQLFGWPRGEAEDERSAGCGERGDGGLAGVAGGHVRRGHPLGVCRGHRHVQAGRARGPRRVGQVPPGDVEVAAAAQLIDGCEMALGDGETRQCERPGRVSSRSAASRPGTSSAAGRHRSPWRVVCSSRQPHLADAMGRGRGGSVRGCRRLPGRGRSVATHPRLSVRRRRRRHRPTRPARTPQLDNLVRPVSIHLQVRPWVP
jgi:hypothetical protein